MIEILSVLEVLRQLMLFGDVLLIFILAAILCKKNGRSG